MRSTDNLAYRAQLRVFGAGEFLERFPFRETSPTVGSGEIADLVGRAESGYYTPLLEEDFLRLGQRLYAWVDGSDRVLSRSIAAEIGDALAMS